MRMGTEAFNHQSNAPYPIDLSVIIVSFNTRALLHQCLQSIRNVTPETSLEIIVVDNNSQDSSADMVRSCFPEVNLIINQGNRGFSAACNQGLRIMRGKYACLLNPDTLVLDGAFDHMIRFIESKPKAGVLGCKLLNIDKTVQSSCFKFYSHKTVLFDYCLLPKSLDKSLLAGVYKSRDLRESTEVDWVLGACQLLRGKAIKVVGLLDEDLFLYSEEVDWCYRAKKQGWEVWFTPDAQVIHYGGQAAEQQSQPALTQLYRSRYQFFQKHYGRGSAYLLKILISLTTVWNSLFLLLRFLLKRIKGKELLKQVSTYWKVARQ